MSDDPHSFQTLRKYAETGPGVGETLYLNLAEDTLDDRHLVIIKSASIDNALREALQAELRQDLKPGENRKLFGTDDAPLGRFSARIQIAFALSMFGRKTFRDLHTIRFLRNQFAHSRRPLHFELDEVKAVCERLREAAPYGQLPTTLGARGKFTRCANALSWTLYLIWNPMFAKSDNDALTKMPRLPLD